MKINLAFSSCPNDTFIFDALVNRKIHIENFDFNYEIADINYLNYLSDQAEFDVIKLSFNKYFQIIDKYQLLTSGSAMGENCGPLLISKRKIYPDEIHHCKIAIPGLETTANLLLNIFYSPLKELKVYLFSDIEDAVISDECDAGLIIHETRFTYYKKGLLKISDLGLLWEEKYKCPLPLGGIAIKRDLSQDIKIRLNELMRKSVVHALNNPMESYRFVKSHAIELDDDVIRQHIELYVNNYTVDLGEKGKKSVIKLYEEYCRFNNNNFLNSDALIFV